MDFTKMTGLELMEAMAAQDMNEQPSIGRLLGMKYESVEDGKVVFSAVTNPDFANPLGQVHGGIAATLIDSAMGCAVHTKLPAGVGYGTIEMKLNYVRAVPTDGTRLTATGRVIHVGRSTAVAQGEVVDDQGRLIAYGTETCLIHEPKTSEE